MIPTLTPYPAYKDSGVTWLGRVPVHWEVRRLGSLLQERRETNEGLRVTQVLSVLRERGVIPYAEKGNIGNKQSDDISRYKVVRPNDIVVNSMNVIIGSVGLSTFTGCISPVYYILTRRDAQDDPRYLNAYFQIKPFQQSLIRLGNGILAHRMRIPMELLKCEPFPRPPADEQVAIVRFLDYMERRIRRVVQARQRQIKLLEEYRQALIHQAVTGQIDVRTGKPYPAYKDSGVAWLGQVPEHWEVRRLKTICSRSALYGANIPATEYTTNGIRFLRTTDITDDGCLKDHGVFVPESVVRDYILSDGDLLISRSGTVGRSFLYDRSLHGPCAYAGYLVRFVPKDEVIPKYLFLFTKSEVFIGFLQIMAISSTIENVNGEKYANCPFTLPSLPEQTAIVEYLDAQTAKIDAAIAALRREIELLREYRERLIADVVTGKVDVREAAARLPEEPPEEESEWIDTEEMAEGEETDEDSGAEALAE
jgi:type I restriction enzyme S subunit